MKIKAASLAFILATSACASSTGIFPSVTTGSDESALVLPNPISMTVDAANSQIVVANSNVDIFFDSGSLAVLSVDATDPLAPTLAVADIIETPNFAGLIADDGAGSLYIPFRAESSTDANSDQLIQYTLSAGSVTKTSETTVVANPFGASISGGVLAVASDDTLDLFDSSLNETAQVDLTGQTDTSASEDVNTESVEDVVIDSTRNLAFVANAGGDLLIIDLTNNSVRQVLSGPQSSRRLLLSGSRLYVTDAFASAVWVFDLDALPAPTDSGETIDDSEFVLATIPIGSLPTAMSLDVTTNRLFVANSGDNSLSVIDNDTLTELARIPLGTTDDLPDGFKRAIVDPEAVVSGTFGGRSLVFVAGFSSGAIAVIDADTLEVRDVFPNNDLNTDI